MTDTADVGAPRPRCRRPLFECAALCGVLFGQMLLGNAAEMMSRPFDLDEIHTFVLVDDPDVAHSLRALGDGVDANPPTLFLLMRAFAAPFGGASEWTLRLFSATSMAVCAVGVFLALRKWVPFLPALAATLCLWMHPLIIRYTYDARFYAPWLAGVAWLALLLSKEPRRKPAPGQLGCLVVATLYTCTIHYFGVVSVGLMAVAYWLAYRRTKGCGAIVSACLVTAVLTVAALVPLARSQREAYSIATWIADPTLTVLLWNLNLLVTIPLLVLAVVWLLCRCFAGAMPSRRVGEQLRSSSAWLGLLLMPIAMIAFSYLVQPVLQPRYMLPVLLGFLPIYGVLLSRVRRNVLIAVTTGLFVAGVPLLWSHVEARLQKDSTVETIESIASLPAGPVVFEARYQYYPVVRYGEEVRDRCFLLDFEDGNLPAAPRDQVFNRDIGRRFAEWYPRFQLFAYRDLHRYERVYVVVSSIYDHANVAARFPRWRVRWIGSSIVELTKQPNPRSASDPR